MVFIGGESRHRWLCQQTAQELGIPAQVGDPVARMNRGVDVGADCGFDRGLPRLNWSVAVGLSMGPVKQGAVREREAA